METRQHPTPSQAHSACTTCPPSSKGATESKVAEESAGKDVNLIDLIKQEHQEAKQLYSAYQSSSDPKMKLCKGRCIIEAISKHAGREEIALYPAYRDIPALGERELEHSKAEHLKVSTDLYELNKMTEVNSEYDQLLSKIMSKLNHHMQDEETRVLPIFERDCPKDKCVQVLNSYKNAVVTDQPHPSAPHEGKAAAAAHIASIPIDAASKAMRSE